jgi:hypothetical protein
MLKENRRGGKWLGRFLEGPPNADSFQMIAFKTHYGWILLPQLRKNEVKAILRNEVRRFGWGEGKPNEWYYTWVLTLKTDFLSSAPTSIPIAAFLWGMKWQRSNNLEKNRTWEAFLVTVSKNKLKSLQNLLASLNYLRVSQSLKNVLKEQFLRWHYAGARKTCKDRLLNIGLTGPQKITKFFKG